MCCCCCYCPSAGRAGVVVVVVGGSGNNHDPFPDDLTKLIFPKHDDLSRPRKFCFGVDLFSILNGKKTNLIG